MSNEADFILSSIAEQGREAHQRLERSLKPELPEGFGLADEVAEYERQEKLTKSITQERPEDRPESWIGDHWGQKSVKLAKAATEEPTTAVIVADKDLDPQDPRWGWRDRLERRADAVQRAADEHEDDADPEPEPEILPDRTTRRERHIRNMRACILARMQDGVSRATAVAELLKIAGSTYSRAIVREAEAQSPDA